MSQSVLSKFKFAKKGSEKKPFILEFKTEDGKRGSLVSLNDLDLQNEESIRLLAKWRDENQYAFPSQFKVTLEGTKIWLEKGLLVVPDRILFWVVDETGKKIGHVGLFRLINNNQIEIDNIVRGEPTSSVGLMFSAILRLLEWQRKDLGVPNSYLRVFSTSDRALKLYEKLNYKEIQRVPLKKEIDAKGSVLWTEIVGSPYTIAEKYFITMKQDLEGE